MKIILEKPYSSDWRMGYVQPDSKGRKCLTLYNSDSDRTVTPYARYLMAVHLGRYLTDDEQVDHIDNDRSNDHIDNLQIITGDENRKKFLDFFWANRVPNHGTLTEYRYCKCDLCRLAKREYMLKYKRNR